MEAMPSRTKVADADHGQSLMEEAAEDDLELALGLSREPVDVASRELDAGADAGQRVGAGLDRGDPLAVSE